MTGVREPIVLENDFLRLELDADTGGVRSLVNRAAGLELVDAEQPPALPWRVQLADIGDDVFDRRPVLRGKVYGKTEIVFHFLKEVVGGVWTSAFASFAWRTDPEYSNGTAVELVWRREDEIELHGRVELAADSPNAVFRIRVRNATSQSVIAVEYPIVDGIQPLGGDGSDNWLAHSVDGGFLFQDPCRLFDDPGIIRHWKQLRIIDDTDPVGHPDEGHAHGGLYRVRAYPNGFEGSPMQFFAYYKEALGGFYFGAHDPHNTEKLLNVFASDGRRGLTASFVHYAWDWQPGRDLTLDYPTMVGALFDGTWYEAAERYRNWATVTGVGHPEWCREGTLRERVSRGTASRWLVEGVGFNTFGIPMSIEVAHWYEALHGLTDRPVFHIVGHDWEGGAVRVLPGKWQKLRDLMAPNGPGPTLYQLADLTGIEPVAENEELLRDLLIKIQPNLWSSFRLSPMDYRPPRFHPANVEAIRAGGDYFVPFLWLDFIGHGHDTERYGTVVPITPFTNAFMCPTTEYWRDWHREVDVSLVEAGVDGIYYDVSASCATPSLCLNRDHDHPIGFGRGLISAYEEVFRDSKRSASEANGGDYIPIGTEVIIENLVSVVDYAQCRAGAGLQATMEGEEFVEWQKDRRAIKIPMFSFVYHEYGPVLLDGCAKLSASFGEIFYEIAARVALEGGLLQLNYEFSPLELFEGMTGSSYQLVYTGQLYEDPSPPRVDPSKAAFLREIAEARTGFARRYLAYGRMIPSLPISGRVADVTLDWNHFNSIHRLRLESGEYTTPSLIQVGWSDGDSRLGFVFVNLLHDDAQTVEVTFDPSRYGRTPQLCNATLTTSTDTDDLGSFDGSGQFTLSLPPRRVCLLEFVPDRS